MHLIDVKIHIYTQNNFHVLVWETQGWYGCLMVVYEMGGCNIWGLHVFDRTT